MSHSGLIHETCGTCRKPRPQCKCKCAMNRCDKKDCCLKTVNDDNHEPRIGFSCSVIVRDVIQNKMYIYDANGIWTDITPKAVVTDGVVDVIVNGVTVVDAAGVANIVIPDVDLTAYRTSLDQDAIDATKVNLTVFNTFKETVEGHIMTIEGDVDMLKTEISVLGSTVAADSTRIQSVEGDMVTVKGNITTLQGEVVSLEGMFDNYYTKTEVNSIVSQINTAEFVGPFPTTGDIPTPYDTNDLYLVGAVAPYEIWVAINDVLTNIGSTNIDMTDYRTAADQDTIDAAQDTAITAAGNLPRAYTFNTTDSQGSYTASLTQPGTFTLFLGDGLEKGIMSHTASNIIAPIKVVPATASVLGGVKVGAGLAVTADGTLSATGGVAGTVSTVNGVSPDLSGEVTITGSDITVDSGTGTTIDAEFSNHQNAINALQSSVVDAQATADSAATAAEGAEALAMGAEQEAISAFAEAQNAMARADDAYDRADDAMNIATAAQDSAAAAQATADAAAGEAATAQQTADSALQDAAQAAEDAQTAADAAGMAQDTADGAQSDATNAIADAAAAKADAATALSVATSALKTGDNISALVNDAGFLTAATLPDKYEMILDNQLDGTTMVFTLSEPVDNETVFYNGVKLRKGLSYTITPTQLTLTLSQAPLVGEALDIEYWK